MKCFACSHPIPDDAIYCCYCGRKCPTAKPSPTHRRERNTGTVYKRPNGKYQVTVTIGWYIENGKRKRRTITKTFVKKIGCGQRRGHPQRHASPAHGDAPRPARNVHCQ